MLICMHKENATSKIDIYENTILYIQIKEPQIVKKATGRM